MATAMLEGGADIRFIQALLGHSSMETTSIYTRVAIGKLREIHSATHPAETKAHLLEPRSADDNRMVEHAELLETLSKEATEEVPVVDGE